MTHAGAGHPAHTAAIETRAEVHAKATGACSFETTALLAGAAQLAERLPTRPKVPLLSPVRAHAQAVGAVP